MKLAKQKLKRYFEECFKFMTEYKGIGKENILSAVVHLDEETPHMHPVYIPVVNSKDKKEITYEKYLQVNFGKVKIVIRIYKINFYKYITEKGFNLERGKENTNREHISTDDMKN